MKKLLMGILFGVGVLFMVPTLPASAAGEPVATFIARPGDDSDRVDLFDERGTCPQDAKRALFTYRPGAPRLLGNSKVEGCWALIDSRVYMGFDDGDRAAIPAEVFKWASGHAPRPPM